MPRTSVIPVRLTPEQQQEAKTKQEAYGLASLSELIRFSIKKLRTPQKKTLDS